MWAFRRRLSIIGIVTAFFMVVFIIPYAYTHREIPTCTDNKQNQDEQGVDCSGPCSVVCKNLVKELDLIWTKVFPIRPGEYDLVAYVENPNFEVGIEKFSYTTRLYDEDGNIIASRSGEGFARPSERFIIFTGGLLTGNKIAKNGSIEINQDFDWIKTTRPETTYSVSDKLLTGADQKPKLIAKIHNLTSDIHRNIDVSALIYDSKNNPIGVSNTTVLKIEPNGEQNLIFTWPSAFNYVAETESCDAPVDSILLLDRSGSMASESKNPPQPFTQVKDAASSFVDLMSMNNYIGMESFSTVASDPIDLPLTNNFVKAKRVITTTNIGTDGIQYTNTGDAILKALNEFSTQRTRSEARKIIILLTDGEALEPNRPLNPDNPKDMEFPKKYAIDEAKRAKDAGVGIYTIGLGVNANEEFLKAISSVPENYYAAPSAADLRGVYQKIARSICKKSPSIIEIIPRVNNVVPAPQTP